MRKLAQPYLWWRLDHHWMTLPLAVAWVKHSGASSNGAVSLFSRLFAIAPDYPSPHRAMPASGQARLTIRRAWMILRRTSGSCVTSSIAANAMRAGRFLRNPKRATGLSKRYAIMRTGRVPTAPQALPDTRRARWRRDAHFAARSSDGYLPVDQMIN